jgi:hypothetical protein
MGAPEIAEPTEKPRAAQREFSLTLKTLPIEIMT